MLQLPLLLLLGGGLVCSTPLNINDGRIPFDQWDGCEREGWACECSEAFTWDEPVDGPTIEWYEISRRVITRDGLFTGAWENVGTLLKPEPRCVVCRTYGTTYPDDLDPELCPAPSSGVWRDCAYTPFVGPVWHYALDIPFPIPGTLYEYTTQSCNSSGCSDLGTPLVRHQAASYTCYNRDGAREACFAGDPLPLSDGE